MCDQAQDTHLKASDPATWDTVYHGTYKPGTAPSVSQGLYRAGRTNTLNKTRALLMMDTGEVQSFLLMALVLCDQIFAQGLFFNCRVQILHLGDL